MDGLCALIVLLVSLLAAALRGSVDPGVLGFAISYMLVSAGLFQWTIRQSAEVESQMTSVERINAYVDLEPEPYTGNGDDSHTTYQYDPMVTLKNSKLPDAIHKINSSVEVDPVVNFSYKRVTLEALTATYRLDLDPVLKGLTASIPFGSKVGVCGRTGSGKSSFLLALLRLNIITGGDVLLDALSLVHMPLEQARSMISLIPQGKNKHTCSLSLASCKCDLFNGRAAFILWYAALQPGSL
jgi:ATP-binding cassette subfamily C (CFTR/MRP) protein 4